jgi:hypothetical protein
MDNISTSADASIDRLKEISTWVSSVQDLDQLLELIIETATRMMDAKASSLLLLDQKTKKLHFKVATGEKGTDVKQFEIDLGQGIAGHHEVPAGGGDQGLAARDVLLVFREENLRHGAAFHLLDQADLAFRGDAQQVGINPDLTPQGDPAPVGDQGLLLHADLRQQYVQLRLFTTQLGICKPVSLGVHGSVPKKIEQRSDLQCSTRVGEIFVFIDGKRSVGQAVAAVQLGAQVGQSLRRAAGDDLPVVEAGKSAEAVGGDMQPLTQRL